MKNKILYEVFSLTIWFLVFMPLILIVDHFMTYYKIYTIFYILNFALFWWLHSKMTTVIYKNF